MVVAAAGDHRAARLLETGRAEGLCETRWTSLLEKQHARCFLFASVVATSGCWAREAARGAQGPRAAGKIPPTLSGRCVRVLEGGEGRVQVKSKS